MSRTVVNLRDDLMERTERMAGVKKKVEIVDLAMGEFVANRDIRKAILELEGRVQWQGNLKAMRKDRKIDFG